MVIDAGRIKHLGDLMHKSIASNGTAVASNWKLSADGQMNVVWTPESAGGSVSFGSNSNDVGNASAPGASTLSSRADHVHRGVRSVSHSSNTLYGDIELQTEGGLYIVKPAGNILTLGSTGTGGSGSLTIQDEGTPLSTAATTLDFVGAGVTATGSGATKTITIPGGSSSQQYAFPFDAPPASPHAKDDEFPGTSLDAKWTNPVTSAAGQTNTIVVANGAMTLEPSTTGSSSTGKHVFGIRQAAPSGSFTLTGKFAEGGSGDDIRSGFFVGVSGGKAHVCGPFLQDAGVGVLGVTTYSETADWSGFDGFLSSLGYNAYHGYWIKITWDSATSTHGFYFSLNGTTWKLITTRASQSQPTAIGICIYSNSGTIKADEMIGASWFRVTEP